MLCSFLILILSDDCDSDDKTVWISALFLPMPCINVPETETFSPLSLFNTDCLFVRGFGRQNHFQTKRPWMNPGELCDKDWDWRKSSQRFLL